MKKFGKNNKTTEKNETLDFLVQELLSTLRERSAEVLTKRFGLGKGKNSKPLVLEEIGKKMKITRERVRQIEVDGFKKLHQLKKSDEFKELIDQAIEIIKNEGGFCERSSLKEQLIKNISQKERNQLMFILNSSIKLQYKKSNLRMEGFWFLAGTKIDRKIVEIHRYILNYLKEKREPKKIGVILSELRKSTWNKFFEGERGETRLKMIMKISRLVDKNILYEYGPNNWRSISQRGSREKAYLVLKKHQKPLHFCEITDHINRFWKNKKALSQTVHNELIKDRRFVLVGRGIYALETWGYPSGTVKEIIIDFLKKYNSPIERKVIIDYVLAKKQVKNTTVLVTLTDKNIFHKDEQGRFTLKTKK